MAVGPGTRVIGGSPRSAAFAPMGLTRGVRRMLSLLLVALGAAGALLLVGAVSAWWWCAAVPLLALTALGGWDLTQRRHSVLRNYPLLGHLRFLLEALRPELQQYFVERNFDGRPYDREVRTIVYERAKGAEAEEPFGTERDVYEDGYEFLEPSMRPVEVPEEPPVVRVGGPDCTQPYDMALLNVSAMSFGALSANAILALNRGAALGVSRTTRARAVCPTTICGAAATSSGRSAPGTSGAVRPKGTSRRGSSRTRPRCPR